jgi:hypothetical protein
MTTTEPPIAPAEPMHPTDRGMEIRDWAHHDFPAFADAVLGACGGDEASILADMVERQSRNQPVRVPERSRPAPANSSSSTSLDSARHTNPNPCASATPYTSA